MTRAASSKWIIGEGMGQARTSAWGPGDSKFDPIRGSIFRLHARGPGDSRIIPVTAGTLENRGLNHELQATPAPITTRVPYSVFWLHPCDTFLKRPDAAREERCAFNYNDESITTRAGVSIIHPFSLLLRLTFVLQKMECFEENLSYIGIGVVESRGDYGGIWFLVDSSFSNCSLLDIDDFHLSVKLLSGSSSWVCNAVYVSLQ
ncbi:hypothetical protein PIB30_013214 [Stylosanthes scabra]|uniref:Uncharacterized protein n=1 Tax=Stylosanthes scabra TaxID=79078 RepID=A0ABU6Q692_9FABA|nr:hypothetical protein [Stylosanthes scabra]